MLHAISLNKAGRNLTNDEFNWRQLFAASEDSLTSTIFGNLLHLPVELFWQILNNACCHKKLTSHSPSILGVEFWPHWQAEGLRNIIYVEPDVFIRTADFDLIIEVKRSSPQITQQWENELQGYLNDYKDEQKDVILLAIGGITEERPEPIHIQERKIEISTCHWINVLNEVKDIRSKLEKTRYHLNNIDSTLIILSDIIMGFGIHGYATGKWLENEDFSRLVPINYYNLLKSSYFQINK